MLKFIKPYKKWIALTILLTLVIFMLRFPWEKTLQKAASVLLKTLPLSADPSEVEALFFPPGIAFYKCFFEGPSFLSQLEVDELQMYPAFSKLLALKPGMRAFLKKDNSSMTFTVWLQNKKSEDQEIKEIYIKGQAPKVNLSLMNDLDNPLKMFGNVRFRFDFMSPGRNLQKAKGAVSLTGLGVAIKDGLISTNLGDIALPDLKWSEVNLKMRLKEKELTIERLQLGTAKDSLFVQLRGNIELKFIRNRVKLSYYDLQTQIEVNRNLQSSLITTLDIFLDNTKTPIDKGTRYLARIRGTGNRTPDIEKLSVF